MTKLDEDVTPAGTITVTRHIPVPTTVSEQAQAFLGMSLFTGGEQPEEPALDDTDAWRALWAATNEMLTAIMEARAGVPVFVITPEGAPDNADAPVYLDIHGGGFTIGSGDTCRAMAKGTAGQVRMKVYAVDYRMPPDHPYPAAVDDCVAVYRELLKSHAPERIVVGGGSAGGNLAAATMLRARDEGLPLPAALVLMTPEADLTESGDSFETNLGLDNVLTARLTSSIALYAGGHDLTDPYLSPLFGDFTLGYPPTFLQTGTRDLFLSNTVLMHRKLRAAGIDAELHVWEAMPHGGFFDAPEDAEIAQEIRHFIAKHVGP
jgi:monoterpene epsilon-lactone hydrolase